MSMPNFRFLSLDTSKTCTLSYSNRPSYQSPDWCTDTFTVQCGVLFQGDTLSPIIFLLCLDLEEIKLASQHPSKGYINQSINQSIYHTSLYQTLSDFHPSMPPSTCYGMREPLRSRQDGTNARLGLGLIALS